MTKYALIAALLLSLSLGAAAWWQAGRADSAESRAATLIRSVATLEASLTQRAAAAKIASERAARWQVRAGELDATIQSILTADLGECADAQLDPDLADLLGRLRSAD